MSECRERCTQELEEMRKNQTERVQLLLQQHEEKEKELKKEYREKEEALKAEKKRVLSLLLEENESQEALMLAKHDGGERAARKADELKSERRSSAPSLPQIPECPVSNIPEYTIGNLLKGTVIRSNKLYFGSVEFWLSDQLSCKVCTDCFGF